MDVWVPSFRHPSMFGFAENLFFSEQNKPEKPCDKLDPIQHLLYATLTVGKCASTTLHNNAHFLAVCLNFPSSNKRSIRSYMYSAQLFLLLVVGFNSTLLVSCCAFLHTPQTKVRSFNPAKMPFDPHSVCVWSSYHFFFH